MRWPARRLPVLAGLFAVGAALKLVDGLGAAMAQMPAAPSALLTPAAMADTSAAGAQSALPGVSAELLIDLRRREAELEAHMASLSAREQALAEVEARLRDQIAELDAAERRLQATMALADQAAEDDLRRLTEVFEAMRPEQAAQVVAEMAPDFAAGLIARLQPATAATILAGLEPRLAYGLAAIIAGRNAEVPRRN